MSESEVTPSTPTATKSIRVFLDSGLQRAFVPLRKPPQGFNAPALEYEREDGRGGTMRVKPPTDLMEAIDEIEFYESESVIPSEGLARLDGIFDEATAAKRLPEIKSDYPWLRMRYGRKEWKLPDGNVSTLCGIWFFIETNTADGSRNGGVVGVYDRGLFYQKNALSDGDKQRALEDDSAGCSPRRGESPYLAYEDDTKLGVELSEVLGGALTVKIIITRPAGVPHDVDLVLDLGNTRSSALLFDHVEKDTFNPLQFKQNFKPLRIKPDPYAGEFASIDDVEAGIADSWFVLHELDHQRYRSRGDSKEPDLISREWLIEVKTETKGSWPFRHKEKIAEGCVIERIPQMFMEISPVLIGDAASRLFNLPYARNLAEKGASMQQSSPKRFYWDDERVKIYWSMLLNEWDKHYEENVKDAASLPMMQGDLCRFIDENTGRVVDSALKDNTPAAERPDPYPASPAYPRQSTLTWFLLHLLERAMAQANDSFKDALTFVPRRFRKVLVTYPSGWTDTEVARYRECCQEALDIFSAVNVYKGVASPDKLELVAREESPDEAVAGQLPFIFSETIRYPGQSVGDWIAAMGRCRRDNDGNDSPTVRVMNFDIGGGTTDISVIEYRDKGQIGSGLNDLSARLLFKDGQALAGDDLLKRIIEAVVIGRFASNNPLVGNRVISIFSSAANNLGKQTVRSRIVRTCLMPLATYCLSHTRAHGDIVQFSARDAGIQPTNWREFNEILGGDGDGISIDRDQPCFSFDSEEIANLIDETFAPLFRSCALYAAAYEVDLVVFSGKTSEQPHIRAMAKRVLPVGEERLLFARSFRPGQWYPFTNSDGFISDAKTVTVVGAALYYALAGGFINGWTIKTEPPAPNDVRNEWGVYSAMTDKGDILMGKEAETSELIRLVPGVLLARRRNIISSPEPVFKICCADQNYPNRPVAFTFERKLSDDGTDESIVIASAIDADGNDVTDKFFLKLHPCVDSSASLFWQETGLFDNIEL